MEIANEVLDQTTMATLDPSIEVITGRRMMAVLNSAAAVAISTAMGPATVMPARQAPSRWYPGRY
jgi:hypothetical protein